MAEGKKSWIKGGIKAAPTESSIDHAPKQDDMAAAIRKVHVRRNSKHMIKQMYGKRQAGE